MTLCIESERVIMLKNWCVKLGNCARDPTTEIGLTQPATYPSFVNNLKIVCKNRDKVPSARQIQKLEIHTPGSERLFHTTH
jgi:hypothetical protein